MTNGQGGSAILSPGRDDLDETRVDETKRRLRQQARAKRTALHEHAGPAAAIALANRFLAAIPVARNSVVAGYWPMGTEIDVLPLGRRLRESGAVTALPAVVDRRNPLVFREWHDDSDFEDGPYGTRHPGTAAAELEPDLVIVPLLAFDVHGNRLGYGGGYYDRTLADLRARRSVLAIGVAFDHQKIGRLQVGVHDARLDGVVTDLDVYYPIPS